MYMNILHEYKVLVNSHKCHKLNAQHKLNMQTRQRFLLTDEPEQTVL